MRTETKIFETQLAAQLGPADPQTWLARRQENLTRFVWKIFLNEKMLSEGNPVLLNYVVTSG